MNELGIAIIIVVIMYPLVITTMIWIDHCESHR